MSSVGRLCCSRLDFRQTVFQVLHVGILGAFLRLLIVPCKCRNPRLGRRNYFRSGASSDLANAGYPAVE